MKNQGWHAGELALQREAGVESSDLLRRGIRSRLSPLFMQFIAVQRMAIAATLDADGRVWASIATGAPGFVRAADDQTIVLDGAAAKEAGIIPHLEAHATIGLLVMDPETRRRVRLNGSPRLDNRGDVIVRIKESFGNCQQYIQKRRMDSIRQHVDDDGKGLTTDALSADQRQWISEADTFFIASYHPDTGADASHRGGQPGFVRAPDGRTIVFPDYSGNNMFQTLGNLRVDPRAGLLFADFVTGRTLQVTGVAGESGTYDIGDFPGAQRVLAHTVERVVERKRGHGLRGTLIEYSPLNPR